MCVFDVVGCIVDFGFYLWLLGVDCVFVLF